MGSRILENISAQLLLLECGQHLRIKGELRKFYLSIFVTGGLEIMHLNVSLIENSLKKERSHIQYHEGIHE